MSLPTGGGAIRGIGDKFAANPATGAGSMRVPLAVSPGRSGFQPDLTLSYDSSTGNGPFGLGWSLGLPAITRKTDRRLPRYDDATESDVFVLSGAEDLVPALQLAADGAVVRDAHGRAVPDESTRGDYRVKRYRSRTEGAFARVERWTSRTDPVQVFWRSITTDNTTTVFGATADSRIADPAAPGHVFSWLACERYDDRGNAIRYTYAEEDAAGIDFGASHEQHRRDHPATAQRYPKSIRYGNRVSRLDPDDPDGWREDWLFEVVFDYDEGHYEQVPLRPGVAEDAQHRFVRASLTPSGEWSARPDPFSSNRSGFEERTYRRCRRVLMFHRMPELGPEPCLVRATEFDYADAALDVGAAVERAHRGSTRFASFLMAITQHGLVATDEPVAAVGPARFVTYLRRSLPPLELGYSRAEIDPEVRTLDPESAANLPVGLGTGYQWVDLDGEGLSGVLAEQGAAWWFTRNLGGGRLGRAELLDRPSPGLSGAQLLDLAGDGCRDLVDFAGTTPGFFERTDAAGWAPQRTFASLPNIRWDDADLRFVDLDGDGHADLLVMGPDGFTWHPSLAEDGFDRARQVPPPWDHDGPARLVFSDGTDSLHLADLDGDGLADLVRVRNGEVCYWPNLGHGRFGPRVTMGNPPLFDLAGQFSPERLVLADTDGSGVTDLVYLGMDGVRIWLNQSGNRWSDAIEVPGLPPVGDVTGLAVVDLLGTGTACLVWSSPWPADASAPVRYVDLACGGKPHLLVEVRNNLGAETRIDYAASTRFFLADRAAGTPWITRLPFPVHVVERVETVDRVSRNRFVTRYAYHHGFFDGVDREFRGFGRVDQRDTEEYDWSLLEPGATNLDPSSYVPPVLTRTWYHTGAHLGRDRISNYFAGGMDETDTGEYFREASWDDAAAAQRLLADTQLPAGLTPDEEREACRALRGSMLRQEVFAEDGSDRADLPFTVTEQSFAVRCEQPAEDNRHGVFLVHPLEAITYDYERDPADPRTQHAVTLAVNRFGQVTRSASLAYGRLVPDPGLSADLQAEQARTLATHTEYDYTNPVEGPDDYRGPLPAETRAYELAGLALPPGQVRLTLEQVAAAIAGAALIEPSGTPTPGVLQRRLVECERTLYRRDDLAGACALGVQESRGLAHEGYRLAFTPGLLMRTYRRGAEDLLPDPASVLCVDAATNQAADRGGYVDLDADGRWWIPTGRVFHAVAGPPALELDQARRHFFQPRRYRSPFHVDAEPAETLVTFDPHDLVVVETLDSLGNRVTAELDHRTLAPARLVNANGNRSAVAFDALGLVVATALLGKDSPAPPAGDRLTGFEADLTPAQVRAAFADPLADPHALLGRATTRLVYDLDAYRGTADQDQPAPAALWALARVTHESDLAPGVRTAIEHSFTYSDGFGREIQKKVRSEAGPVPQRDATGSLIVVDGRPVLTAGEVEPRWTGSGWTEHNNKGKPVKHYEPFFSDTHHCDFDARIGVTAIAFYDPIGRAVAVLHPNHTYAKTRFHAWRRVDHDANDTVAPHGTQTGDPRTDPDIAGYVRGWSDRAGPAWQTWLAQREGGTLGSREQEAAQRASAHADTPSTSHLDPLGRVFLVRSHNGFTAGGDPITLDTRLVLDIEGNQRSLVDALGRTALAYEYDLAGGRTRQSGMESGHRWVLNDVTGQPVRAWDGRGHTVRTSYDRLRRPLRTAVTDADPARAGVEVVTERLVYGEQHPEAVTRNLRGQVYLHLDQSGARSTEAFDLGGNPTRAVRRLVGGTSYKDVVDWRGLDEDPGVLPPGAAPLDLTALEAALVPVLDAASYVTRTTYDALNRSIQAIPPHADEPGAPRHVVQPTFNAGGLLERVDVWLGRTADPPGRLDPVADPPSEAGVADIDYDARGQRVRIAYANGVVTRCAYDPDTFRLVGLYTRRGAAFDDCGEAPPPPRGPAPEEPPAGVPCGLQNLRYTYDPAGNLTHRLDAAQPVVFFRNQVVTAGGDYAYDALYRLVRATGREHLGQGGAQVPHSYRDAPHVGLPQPGDGTAMGRYCETYDHDDAGNLVAMTHRASCPGAVSWSRVSTHGEVSLLEDGTGGTALRHSNRLTAATVSGGIETYSVAGDGYDQHGNLLRMPQLQALRWDHRDQLVMTRRQAVDPADDEGLDRHGERTYYVYDAGGQRVRKVTESATGQVKDERRYLGGVEVYLSHAGATAGLVRETLHVMDGQQRIALVDHRNDVDDGTPPQVVRVQLSDHLGSASLELDDRARVLAYEEYTPYGSTSYQASRGVVEVASRRYRYAGRERDEESGLYHLGARYYAAWLGRWTSCDPAGAVDGANLYQYVRGNPMRLVDPTGRDGEPPGASTVRLPEPQFRVGPIRPSVSLLSSSLQFHDLLSEDRSVSGEVTGLLSAHGYEMVDVPLLGQRQMRLDTDLAAHLRTGTGARFGGNALVTLGTVGEGLWVTGFAVGTGSAPVPAELPASEAIVSTLIDESAGHADANVRFSGAIQVPGLTLASGSGQVQISDGAVSLSARAGLMSLATLDVSAHGGPLTSEGLSMTGTADLELLGMRSLHADLQASVSLTGDYALRGGFHGYIPPATYVAGNLNVSSANGASVSGFAVGLTYMPEVSVRDPSPIPAAARQNLGLPADPAAPSGPALGFSYMAFEHGAATIFTLGYVPPIGIGTPGLGLSLSLPFSVP